MKFNVLSFLHSHHIPYITKGVNVKRGEININCPFCAKTSSPDPSYHLGIDEDNMRFSCWRNKRHHSGKTLHKLIMVLAQCNYYEACQLLGQKPIWIEETAFDAVSFQANDTAPTTPLLEFPHDIIPLDVELRRSFRFVQYLMERGYSQRSVSRLAYRYNLHYAISGQFKDRIVIPNYVANRLVNWTGRSIHKDTQLRYLSLDHTRGALMSIKECLFNEPQLFKGGRLLVVNEGPFDAMKMDFYGASLGIRATCLFNKKATHNQLGCLGELTHLFDRIVVMFDRDEFVDQCSFVSQMDWTGLDSVVDWNCPSHVSDPGDLSGDDVKELCNSMLTQLCGVLP